MPIREERAVLLRAQIVLLDEVAQVPKGKLLAEGGELTRINGDRARQGVEIHRANDAAEGSLGYDAELFKHFCDELRAIVAKILLVGNAEGRKK